MVIGYSFGDIHIDNVITQATLKNDLRLFLIDPRGVDVLGKRGPLIDCLQGHIIGASRRGLRVVFGSDWIDRAKITRSFEP